LRPVPPHEGEGGIPALLALVAADLDARLERHAVAPVAVAFSGGGDSLALLLAAKVWADGAGRRLIALTVDHGLQEESAGWARWCGDRAGRLGVAHRILVWRGPKPRSGLSAAAREARHALIAAAARQAGARIVLMGHTLDDCMEGRAMRAEGSSVGEPRIWAPSPVWPGGAGVFILRPLLAVRRARLRDLLAGLGETWIEDPANSDLRSARARARASLAADQDFPPPRPRPSGAGLFAEAAVDTHGAIAVPRSILGLAPPGETRAFVAAALLCAAGTVRPPRGRSLDALTARIVAAAPFAATLAGSRVDADADAVRFRREPGRNPTGRILAGDGAGLRRTVMGRLAAACGAIQSEAAIGRVAERPATP